MDTVVVSRTFKGNLEELLAFTRTLKSRENWPGAVLQWEKSDTLYYGVGMRLKAATMTDVEIEEQLREVERLPGGSAQFDFVQRTTWPDGHTGASGEYLFTPGEDGSPNTLRLTYSYLAPGNKLVKTKDLPAFHVAMEKVCARYLEKLIETAGT